MSRTCGGGSRGGALGVAALATARDAVDHYVYVGGSHGHHERRALNLDETRPRRVLITGGASCPDGIIQQVITRINSFFPSERLRTLDAVLRDLKGDQVG